MADTPSNVPIGAPSTASSTRSSVDAPKRATSKMALMLAFAAGAAFSWLLIESVNDDPTPTPTTINR